MVAALVAVIMLVTTSCGGDDSSGDADADTVPIGGLYSESGAAAQYGVYALNGVRMAVEEINRKGFTVGDKRYRFDLQVEDPQSDVSRAVASARKLVQQEKVIAMFGPMVSTLAVPSIPIAMAGDTIQFTPPTAAQAMLAEDPEKYPYLVPSQTPYAGDQGSQVRLGHEVFEKYGVKTIAALNPKDAAGTVYTPLFLQGFEDAGGKVVYNEFFPPGTQDFGPYMQSIAAERPDGLFFGYTDADMIPIMTLARQLDAAEYFIGGAGTTQLPAEKSGKSPYTKYVWAAPVLSINDPSPAVQDFVQRYADFTNTKPTPNVSLAFDSYPFVHVLVKAMQEAGSVTDRDKINAALHGGVWEFPGEAIDKVTIDKQGQAWIPYQICDLLKGSADPTCRTITPAVAP